MIIGTDISLAVCKAEGYTMMEYDARKKFNPDTDYRIFNYYPAFITELNNEIRTDTEYSFNELKKLYLENKKSLDNSCETYNAVDFNNPSYYDFLNLASDLLWYGLID